MKKKVIFNNFVPVFQTPYFNVEENKNPNFSDGKPYYRITGSDSVICCIMMKNGNFLMVKQYRPNLEEETIEFPAGGIENDENPIDAAFREIKEETGLSCKLIYLGAFRLLLNRGTTFEHLYFGFDPKPIPEAIIEKGIETLQISREELLSTIEEGNYFQLAGIGIIQLASWKLNVDIINSKIKNIERNFSKIAI